MVAYTDIEASNALINDDNAPRVAVFVGGTSGVGNYTIKALVTTGASVRIYVIGRQSAEERTKVFFNELQVLNPRAELIWLEGEVSLLAESKRLCETIKSKERHVDLMFLTTGYTPFGSRHETSEGIDISQSLSYYTRTLFIMHLLPLLQYAEAPRVVSVLAGGMERDAFDLDDIDLKKPGSFGMMKAQGHACVMITLTMEKLAAENPHVTFVHAMPGSVATGNVWRGVDDPNSFMGWFVWLFLAPLIGIFSASEETSGQRNLFVATSALFGGRGVPWKGKDGINTQNKQENGLFLSGWNSDAISNSKVISSLRARAQEPLWKHTLEVLAPYL
ncbi:hypothetical protein DE146DRAFT_137155 [Phaeosphaeria sp. MPI-PUGE-AT-0046c]|nr:hypothetical protein DE146DRAFT_137155 [Phaeosphaeria sp. MPI-PUGE-AT-0046c]